MTTESRALETRYEITERRVGASAIVYKATDRNLGWTVAIKTPDEKTRADERRLAKFVEEGKKLARIQHENVLRVHEFIAQGELDDRCYLVTEWMHTTLEEVLERSRLDPNAAIGILRNIAQGLRAIHEAGIVHRDLKPGNILLSQAADRVVISDLGIASDVGAEDTLVGTPKYLAPEVHEEDATVDVRADIYSLGFIGYELLLGKDAFRREFADIYASETVKIQRFKWMNWHRDRERTATPLHELAPEIPEKLSQTVAAMMAKDVAQRAPSVDSLLRALGGAAAAAPSLIKPLTADEAPGHERKGALGLGAAPPWLLYTGAVLLVLLVAFAYFFIGALRGDPDYDAAVAASEAMLAARAAAVEAGAELEPVIRQFTRGEGERAAADGHVKAEAYAEAAESLRAATRWYEEALPVANERTASGVFAARKEAEAARAAAVEAGADSEDIESFGQAERRSEEANAALVDTRFAESADAYREAAKLYEQARVAATKPSEIYLGSSPEEIQQAMLLCAYSGRPCSVEDFADERYRKVELAPFAIDRYEVTNEQFQKFVAETGYVTTAEREGYSWIHTPEGSRKLEGYSWRAAQGPDSNVLSQLDRPVVHVSASDAEAYCNWNGGRRLPTEDEWEFSARGRERRLFPWGDEWDPKRLSWQSTAMQPAPIGSFSAGATAGDPDQRLYDMAGNVWEWTSTLQGAERVLKGGSFLESNPAYFRAAAQLTIAENESYGDIGFRCVKGN